MSRPFLWLFILFYSLLRVCRGYVGGYFKEDIRKDEDWGDWIDEIDDLIVF